MEFMVKESTGCDDAKNYLSVAATDFGTTYSGSVYSLNFKKYPPGLNRPKLSRMNGHISAAYETPTSLLPELKEKEMTAFGYEVQEQYRELTPRNDTVLVDDEGHPMQAKDIVTGRPLDKLKSVEKMLEEERKKYMKTLSAIHKKAFCRHFTQETPRDGTVLDNDDEGHSMQAKDIVTGRPLDKLKSVEKMLEEERIKFMEIVSDIYEHFIQETPRNDTVLDNDDGHSMQEKDIVTGRPLNKLKSVEKMFEEERTKLMKIVFAKWEQFTQETPRDDTVLDNDEGHSMQAKDIVTGCPLDKLKSMTKMLEEEGTKLMKIVSAIWEQFTQEIPRNDTVLDNHKGHPMSAKEIVIGRPLYKLRSRIKMIEEEDIKWKTVLAIWEHLTLKIAIIEELLHDQMTVRDANGEILKKSLWETATFGKKEGQIVTLCQTDWIHPYDILMSFEDSDAQFKFIKERLETPRIVRYLPFRQEMPVNVQMYDGEKKGKGKKITCFLGYENTLHDQELPSDDSCEDKLEILKEENKQLEKEMNEILEQCILRLNEMHTQRPTPKRQMATI